MVLYIIISIFLILILIGYFKVAKKFNIIDKPNERSSHSRVTLRGGGIVFPIAALVWFFVYGFNEPWIIIALFLLSIVSFLDDVKKLSSGIRFFVQVIAVGLLLWQTQTFSFPWYFVVLAFFITIGWINFYNFMDGINGITAIYSLVALITFVWLNSFHEFIAPQLLYILIFSVLIFSFFNVRTNALTFAGDVGSVSMAFLLAWIMILLKMKTGRFEYILLFSVYGIDSGFTIFFRLLKRENIFKPHRTHLYQFLSNEIKFPHLNVSFIYGFTQLVINFIVIYLITTHNMNWLIFVIILIAVSIVYLYIRFLVNEFIKRI